MPFIDKKFLTFNSLNLRLLQYVFLCLEHLRTRSRACAPLRPRPAVGAGPGGECTDNSSFLSKNGALQSTPGMHSYTTAKKQCLNFHHLKLR